MSGITKQRVFIECTNTFFGGHNTGIQRVARNVANHSLDIGIANAEVAPIVWVGFGFCQVKRKIGVKPQTPNGRTSRIARLLDRALRLMLSRLRVGLLLFDRKILRYAGNEKAHDFMLNLRHFLYCLEYLPDQMLSGRYIRFRRGDIVVLVDATWNFHAMLDALFKAQHDQGVKLGVMIHDLFPLILPATCDEITIRRFVAWFNQVVPHADFFVTNSQATSTSLREHLNACSPLRTHPYVIGSFRLGAGLDLASEEETELRDMHSAQDVPGTVLLCVGTIEPRKNHAYLLDAFDNLRQRGIDVSLIIVGRSGWKNAGIMERIRHHRDFGTRLLHYDNASDRILAEAMAKADCLVYPSIAEGFGLPIVEGLLYGLAVFASDIPPFREIGSDYCHFFDLASPASLADQLEQWIAETRSPGANVTQKVFAWPGWDESTRELVHLTLELAGNQ